MSKPFNDTQNYTGLIQECEAWLFGHDYGAISDNTVLLATFTDLINYGQDETFSDIVSVDNTWEYDDSNRTDYPIATTDLVASQADYTLDSTHLIIDGVECLDSNGDYYKLRPIDYKKDIRARGTTETEFLEQDGRPMYYDVRGQSIFLYPAPRVTDVTLSAGLKIFFKRPPEYFTVEDTDKTPGIASIYHDIIVLYACAKYAKQKSMTKKARELDAEIEKRRAKLQEHYSERQVDYPKRVTYNYNNPK